jgi:hypothetical protein
LAFRQLGIPDTTVLSLGGANSAFTYITSLGLGNSLSGQSVLSTTAYSQQGQSGYVHGLFTRDLKGLYRPGHSEQQAAGADYSNLTMGLVSSYTPVDWPELASQLPGVDSLAGQKAAYAYLSWYLLNAWYVQSEYGSQGVPAPYAYDIHYFFTGSLNTFIDYHTFDPATLHGPEHRASAAAHGMSHARLRARLVTGHLRWTERRSPLRKTTSTGSRLSSTTRSLTSPMYCCSW